MIAIQKRGWAYYLKGLLGSMLGAIEPALEKESIIVLNYHGTQEQFHEQFKSQLNYLQKQYELASYDCIFSKTNTPKKARIVFTFDDGLKSNKRALKELEQRGIRAMLFVVPAFIDAGSREYFHSYIRPVTNPSIDCNDEDFLPLTWSELKDLCEKGHKVDSHSLTHRMNNEMNHDELNDEILGSKSIIEDRLGVEVNSFCTPNNTFFSSSAVAIQLIERNYQKHFTTISGYNRYGTHLIYRINVESYWGINQLRFALSRIENKRWRKLRLELNGLKDARS